MIHPQSFTPAEVSDLRAELVRMTATLENVERMLGTTGAFLRPVIVPRKPEREEPRETRLDLIEVD